MSKNVTVRRILLTPSLAKEWWAKNKGNRHFRSAWAAFLADEMRNKRFRLNGDAIMFNDAGEMINGQHRTWAVMESGVSIEVVVMEHCEDVVKEVIDTGCGRRVDDTLKMTHNVARASLVTGAIKMIDEYVDGRRLKVSVGHALEQISVYNEALTWAAEVVPGKSLFSCSPIVAALVYAYKTNPASVREFSRQLFSGADLADGSSILVCRNYIINQGGAGRNRDERHQTFLVVLTAVHRYISRAGNSKRMKINPAVVDIFRRAYESAPARKTA